MDDFWKKKKERDNAERNREGFLDLAKRQKANARLARERNDWQQVSADTTESHRTVHRLVYHASLSEPELGIFIGDAQQRARVAYLYGYRNWKYHYSIRIVDLAVDIKGRTVNISAKANDGFGFEFQSTAKPIMLDSSLGAEVYNHVVVGVQVTLGTQGVASTATIRKQRRSLLGDDVSLIKRPTQIELVTEPVAYPFEETFVSRTLYSRTIMESFAPHTPHTGIGVRSCTLGAFDALKIQRPEWTPFSLRDQSFDIPYMDNRKAEPVVYEYIRDSADWARASSILKVQSEQYGEREFAVMVDAFNQFHVFPRASITAPTAPYAQTVPSGQVQLIAPAFPGWAFVPPNKHIDAQAADPGNWTDYRLITHPETDWKFHPEGKKAVAVMYERIACNFDTTFWSTGASGTPATEADWNTNYRDLMGVQSQFDTGFTAGPSQQRYFTAPGIVEVELQIEITGPDADDYTAQAVVTTHRRPSTHTRCALFVGYAWMSLPKLEVRKGDLLTFDVEHWSNHSLISNGAWSAYTKEYPEFRYDLYSLRNLVSGVEIKTFTAYPILAIDLSTCSFVFKIERLERFGDRTSDPDVPYKNLIDSYDISHSELKYTWCAQVVTHGQVRETLFPSTMPLAEKEELQLLIAQKADARLYQINLGAGWKYTPIVTTDDLWTADAAAYRIAWGFAEGFLASGAGGALDPFRYRLLYEYRSNWLREEEDHLVYTADVRWGFWCYQQLIEKLVQTSAEDTFFIHPNGTWCWWCDRLIYNPHRMWLRLDLSTAHLFMDDALAPDGLMQFDAARIEHCIFDRVHFEVRTRKDALVGKKDTSFRELYNRAVRAGREAETLEENIEEIELADMKASFEKNQYEINPGPHPGLYVLDLKATWNGVEYWMTDPAVSGGNSYLTAISQGGAMMGLTFGQVWFTGQERTGFSVIPASERHLRFASPILIQPK